MKKKPRFFCDNCGYEVSSDVKLCPYCGRYFASIRCPACDYSGPDEMFGGGCPMCGYSAPPPPKTKSKLIKSRPEKSDYSEHLPTWMYIVSVLFVLGVVAFISFFLTR